MQNATDVADVACLLRPQGLKHSPTKKITLKFQGILYWLTASKKQGPFGLWLARSVLAARLGRNDTVLRRWNKLLEIAIYQRGSNSDHSTNHRTQNFAHGTALIRCFSNQHSDCTGLLHSIDTGG